MSKKKMSRPIACIGDDVTIYLTRNDPEEIAIEMNTGCGVFRRFLKIKTAKRFSQRLGKMVEWLER